MFDRDEQEISQIIDNGLEAIRTGRATLEQVLEQHPQEAEAIRGELEAGLWLVAQQKEVDVRPGFVSASRKRVLERIQAEARSQGTKHAFFGFAWPRRPLSRLAAAISLFVLLLTGLGGTLTVSQAALPGDNLYAVKRASEQVAYSVTIGEVEKVELSAQFADRRLNETEALITKGDYSTAQYTLADYENSIHQTLTLLEQASGTNSNEVEAVAVTVQQGFTKNAEQLSAIASNVRSHGGDTQVGSQLRSAMAVSISGASIANQVYERLQESRSKPANATSAPSATTVEQNPSVPVLPPAVTATTAPRHAAPLPNPPPPPTDSKAPSNPVIPVAPTVAPPPATSIPLPTATATPNPTATPTNVPTATPAPTDTPVPTQAPTATELPTATPAPTSTTVPVPTDTPIPAPTDTSVPTDLPTAVSPVSPPQTSSNGTPTTAPTNTNSTPVATPSTQPLTPLPTATVSVVATIKHKK